MSETREQLRGIATITRGCGHVWTVTLTPGKTFHVPHCGCWKRDFIRLEDLTKPREKENVELRKRIDTT